MLLYRDTQTNLYSGPHSVAVFKVNYRMKFRIINLVKDLYIIYGNFHKEENFMLIYNYLWIVCVFQLHCIIAPLYSKQLWVLGKAFMICSKLRLQNREILASLL